MKPKLSESKKLQLAKQLSEEDQEAINAVSKTSGFCLRRHRKAVVCSHQWRWQEPIRFEMHGRPCFRPFKIGSKFSPPLASAAGVAGCSEARGLERENVFFALDDLNRTAVLHCLNDLRQVEWNATNTLDARSSIRRVGGSPLDRT
jgi:hypothetical protein